MSLFREIKNSQLIYFTAKYIFRLIENEDDLKYAILSCKVKPEQDEDVCPAGFSIGRAWLKPEDNAPFVICNSAGEKVGFIQQIDHLGENKSACALYKKSGFKLKEVIGIDRYYVI